MAIVDVQFKIKNTCGHEFYGFRNTVDCPECGAKIGFGANVEVHKRIVSTTNDDGIRLVMDYLERKNIWFDWYDGIGEPGYDDKPAIAANWNDAPEKLGGYIECLGIETLWSDEWARCGVCDKAVRTEPDCYGWERAYMIDEECGELTCAECLNKDGDVAGIIDNYINNPRKAVPSWFTQLLGPAGFICYSPDEYCEIFSTGWHPGQTDDPHKVAKTIESELPGYEYLFAINSVGQFDVHWSVFLRKEGGENGL